MRRDHGVEGRQENDEDDAADELGEDGSSSSGRCEPAVAVAVADKAWASGGADCWRLGGVGVSFGRG